MSAPVPPRARSRSSLTGMGIALLLAAAFAAGGTPARADVVRPFATVIEDGGAATLHNLPIELRDALLSGDAQAKLRPAGTAGGMTARVEMDADGLILRPRFPLLPGAPYEAVLRAYDGAETIMVLVAPSEDAAPTTVLGVWPESAVLPENALRLYVVFDRPMARGAATRSIRLEDANGVRLDDSFLNLATELWSADQTRLTLLLDPGRIKRGVGPNETLGAPLADGRAYRLVIDAAMRDARGRPLGEDHVHAFRTGLAERRVIDPEGWAVETPPPGSRAALDVAFDRLVDRANAARTIRPVDGEGRPIPGRVTVTDRAWRFVPDARWPAGVALLVDPLLEDVAGNTICAPFDVTAGEAVPCSEPLVLHLNMAASPG